MKKFLCVFLAVLCVFGALVGYADGAKEPEKKRHIAYLAGATNNEFFRSIAVAIEEEAIKDGAEYTLFDANFDVAKQIEHVQTAATMGCTDIIIFPVEEDSLKDALKKVRKENGINVCSFSFDFGGDTDCYDSIVSIPNYTEAVETAESMKAWVDHKYPNAEANSVKTVLVQASTDKVEMEMDQGVVDTLKADGRFNILEEIKVDINGDNYTTAQNTFDTIMLKYPDVQCICFHYANTLAAAADERALQKYDPKTTDLALFGIAIDKDYINRVASAEEGKSFCRGGGGYDLNAVSKIYHICVGEYDHMKDPVTKKIPFESLCLTWNNASEYQASLQ